MRRWAVGMGVWVLLATPLAGALGDKVPVPENYGQAMRWYERAAEGGDAKAQFYLGVLLESGVRGAAAGGQDFARNQGGARLVGDDAAEIAGRFKHGKFW